MFTIYKAKRRFGCQYVVNHDYVTIFATNIVKIRHEVKTPNENKVKTTPPTPWSV